MVLICKKYLSTSTGLSPTFLFGDYPVVVWLSEGVGTALVALLALRRGPQPWLDELPREYVPRLLPVIAGTSCNLVPRDLMNPYDEIPLTDPYCMKMRSGEILQFGNNSFSDFGGMMHSLICLRISVVFEPTGNEGLSNC